MRRVNHILVQINLGYMFTYLLWSYKADHNVKRAPCVTVCGRYIVVMITMTVSHISTSHLV